MGTLARCEDGAGIRSRSMLPRLAAPHLNPGDLTIVLENTSAGGAGGINRNADQLDRV